jgi:hypothetical protein
MSTIGDLVKSVVSDVLTDMLKKTTGTGKRTRRRKAKAATTTERLKQIEKLLRPTTAKATPAKKQTSRKRTVRTRAKVRRRAT